MRWPYSFLLLVAGLHSTLQAQLVNTDSTKNALTTPAADDSSRYRTYAELSNYYLGKNNDSAFYFIDRSLEIARKDNKRISEALSLQLKGNVFMQLARYAESYSSYLEALSIAEKSSGNESYWDSPRELTPEHFIIGIRASIHNDLAMMLGFVKNDQEQMYHFKQAETLYQQIGDTKGIHFITVMYSRIYLERGQLDSAMYFGKLAESGFQEGGDNIFLGLADYTLGSIYQQKQQLASAKSYFYKAKHSAELTGNERTLVAVEHGLCSVYLEEKQKDSALYYARAMYERIKPLRVLALFRLSIGNAYEMLGKAYLLNGNKDSAIICETFALNVKDSLFNIERKSFAEFRHLNLNETLRIRELEQEKIAYQNKVRTTFFISGLVFLLLIAILLFRSSIQQKKAKRKIENAYSELKSTQAQLIQSEKMASLGELTAGIAHEIQNPLNFINNFSEVNNELIEEMNNENDINEIKVIGIDIKQNNEKIAFHGKRADGIVKGMLQHSQKSTGQKEPTDINKLADEYLRLAYHGLRAKNKEFNAEIKTDFDSSIGNINVIPQDIGRVLLNLYNNAFYAVKEKKRTTDGSYQPTVFVSTRKTNNRVTVSVSDNGNGVPQNIVDKIFQPFFTTKPTGEGTGLGLSLSYDIIKAHGGEIKVETKEGLGSIFIIELPTK